MDNYKESAYPEITTEPKFQGGGVYSDTYSHGGMTKLERFTMAAMQGILSGILASGNDLTGWDRQGIAEEAIGQARATLSELSKQQ